MRRGLGPAGRRACGSPSALSTRCFGHALIFPASGFQPSGVRVTPVSEAGGKPDSFFFPAGMQFFIYI